MTQLFIEPNPALPIVSVAVAFASGSIHDPDGKEGLARLTTRMLRRGSEGLSPEQIEERFDLLGGDFAASASTSSITVQFEVIRRSLEPFRDLAARVLAKPAFIEQQLSRLVREAESEIVEARDSDRGLCSRAFRRRLFEGHPYGRRGAGSVESLRRIDRNDVIAFYERHFVRENAIVAITGDVSETEGKALAEALLAGLPAGQAALDATPPPVARKGRTLVFVDKPGRTQTQMAIGGLGTSLHDADHVPLVVANTAFGGTFTSRLMQEIRAKRGWSYGASSVLGIERQRESFSMWSAPAAADAAACLALELELLHAVRADGLTEEELGFVKQYLVRSHAFEIDTPRKRVLRKLEAALYAMPEGYHDRYLERVAGVTLPAANEALATRLPEDDLIISVVGTYADVGKAVTDAIPNLAKVDVIPVDFE